MSDIPTDYAPSRGALEAVAVYAENVTGMIVITDDRKSLETEFALVPLGGLIEAFTAHLQNNSEEARRFAEAVMEGQPCSYGDCDCGVTFYRVKP